MQARDERRWKKNEMFFFAYSYCVCVCAWVCVLFVCLRMRKMSHAHFDILIPGIDERLNGFYTMLKLLNGAFKFLVIWYPPPLSGEII